MDISIQSSNIQAKVPGVGPDNSLRVTLNPVFRDQHVKYRISISEVGTTQSKVFFDVSPDYPGTQSFFLHGIHYVQVSLFRS